MRQRGLNMRNSATQRPEFERSPALPAGFGDIEQPRPLPAKVWGNEAVRKFTIILVLFAIWQFGSKYYSNNIAFPSGTETLQAFWENLRSLEILKATWSSLQVLSVGYGLGVALACVLSIIATFTRIGRDILETLTAMFSPLPAIALVPLALMWFGLGSPKAMIFVLIHSVLWPVALNMHSGFRSSGTTLRMVGQNYGLGPVRFVFKILIPASFASILTGLKIGWAFAWRTLIAAELVFGSNGDQGGLGWFIFSAKNTLDTAAVFAGLLMVIVIGLLVENLIFRTIEHKTVRKWGMQS